MANIQLQGVFSRVQNWFTVKGSGLDRFDQDFLDCTNATINRINQDADLASRISRVTTIEAQVGLDEKYDDVLAQGIAVALVDQGQRFNVKDPERTLTRMRNQFETGIDRIATDIRNDLQAANSDDDTYDFVGLGHKG